MSGGPARRAAVFLDRDGTIIVDDDYARDATRVRLMPGAGPALRTLASIGPLVVVSNQSGIGRGIIAPHELAAVHARMVELLDGEGITLAATHYCEHHPDAGCPCRKPAAGMLRDAAAALGLDLSRSLMVGDKPSDLQAGRDAGCKTAYLGDGADNPGLDADFRGRDWAELLRALAKTFP